MTRDNDAKVEPTPPCSQRCTLHARLVPVAGPVAAWGCALSGVDFAAGLLVFRAAALLFDFAAKLVRSFMLMPACTGGSGYSIQSCAPPPLDSLQRVSPILASAYCSAAQPRT